MIRTLTALVATLTVVSAAVADDIDQIFNEVGDEAVVAEGALGGDCGYGGDCCGSCCDCCCDVSSWFARGEVVWLRRTRSHPHALTTHDDNNEIVLHTDDLEFDYEPGFRVTVGRHLNCCTSIEASYLRITNFSADAGFEDPNPGVSGNLDPYWRHDQAQFDLRNFEDGVRHLARYESNLHNVELNVRNYRCDNSSVLFGIRYMNIDEDFRFMSFDDPNDFVDVGIYDISTSNDLLGLQVGAQRDMCLMDDGLILGVYGKAGVFANIMDTHNHLYDNGGPNPPRTNDRRGESGERVSTIVEIGVSGTWNVTDRFSIRGGYDVYFVNGVALAAEQLDASPNEANARRKLDDNGTLIYHGPSLGAEMTW